MTALDLSQLSDEQRTALREELRLNLALRDAATDPKALINEIRYFDPVTQAWVEFQMFPPDGYRQPLQRNGIGLLFTTDESGAEDWLWQPQIIDWLHDPTLHSYLVYKARQLGLTLLACAYALWLIVMRPGVNCAAYSYEETEAQKLTQAVWDMYKSLPAIFTQHLEVITPSKGAIPSEWMRLRHKFDKARRLSTFQALPATGLHGHGGRISFSIQDELARQRYGRQIYEAITPAVLSRGGKWIGISTANGVSNPETGEGNFFHHLFDTRQEKKISYVFLPWNAEPTRDEEWYENVAMKLPTVERNRQYPLNEADGFMLSGFTYFDAEVLAYYRSNVKTPLMSGQFYEELARKATFKPHRDGIIQLFEKPKEGAEYVVGVDTSTGRAADYTSADVLDAASGALVAHLHAKLEAPRAAIQIHYLGKLYNAAKIGVERGGGYGEALITALRDGNNLLPRYPNLYRFTKKTAPGKRPVEEYGFPMNISTRPLVLEKLKAAAYESRLPWVSQDHLYEMGTFVHKDTSPSPRAEDGCNDDCVMSLALAWHLYETYGDTPARALRAKTRVRREYQPGPVRAGG
jgi:hypothetical protein